jgi:hypothetical protein
MLLKEAPVPAFAGPVIQAFAHELVPILAMLTLFTMFSSILLALFVALLYFFPWRSSNPQPIFLTVCAIVWWGVALGIIAGYLLV